MAQFDVHEMRDTGSLVVDVQSDLLDPLNTRVVVPLIPVGAGLKPARRLNPVFKVTNEDRILATQFLASVHVAEMINAIDSLSDFRDEITSALDMLYQGF
ncbi:CcdB family protein [uncultured Tateyamaria sp.]|uniref:CcdB family protein n=1 Tax=uncultured Tateyamaria sp. TaxID=455651 RepID=UPI00262433BF|nr:CcdB family protein [uncultured Tateyamaria sp.]